MSREQERIKRKLEKNPVIECNKIQTKFCPELFSMFGNVDDPRHKSYIEYSARTMLGTLYYKSIAGISSMQDAQAVEVARPIKSWLIVQVRLMVAQEQQKNMAMELALDGLTMEVELRHLYQFRYTQEQAQSI